MCITCTTSYWNHFSSLQTESKVSGSVQWLLPALGPRSHPRAARAPGLRVPWLRAVTPAASRRPRGPPSPCQRPRHLLRQPRVPTRSPPGAGRPRSLAETRGCCSGTRSRSGAPGKPAIQSTDAEQSGEAAGAPRGEPAAAPAGGSGGRFRAGEPGGPQRPRPPPALTAQALPLLTLFPSSGLHQSQAPALTRNCTGAGSDVFRPSPGRAPARPLPVLHLDLAHAAHLAPRAASSSRYLVLILRLGPPGPAPAQPPPPGARCPSTDSAHLARPTRALQTPGAALQRQPLGRSPPGPEQPG